jgi:predicted GNAT family acetyltransferase
MTMDNITIADDAAAHRFELRLGGEVAAWLEYNVLKDALLLSHTEVKPAFEGKGFASRLIAFTLDDVRRRGVHAIPVCPFVAGYLKKHPEYLDLVSEDSRRAFLR